MNCACRRWCGDVPEQDDDPTAVCKVLPDAPKGEPVQLVIVHRDAWEVQEAGHIKEGSYPDASRSTEK